MQVCPKPAGQTVYPRGVSTPIGLAPAETIDHHRIQIKSRVTACPATCRAAREFSRTAPWLRIEKSAASKTEAHRSIPGRLGSTRSNKTFDEPVPALVHDAGSGIVHPQQSP